MGIIERKMEEILNFQKVLDERAKKVSWNNDIKEAKHLYWKFKNKLFTIRNVEGFVCLISLMAMDCNRYNVRNKFCQLSGIDPERCDFHVNSEKREVHMVLVPENIDIKQYNKIIWEE